MIVLGGNQDSVSTISDMVGSACNCWLATVGFF